MDPAVWIILIVVGIVFLWFLFRFLMHRLVDRSTDAIANSRRRKKNETSGPEVVRLADMYPEIAVMHYQNGTAAPDAGSEIRQAMPAAAASQGITQQPVAGYPYQTAPGMQPGAVPYGYYPMPAQPRKRTGKGLKITATVVTGIGIFINFLVLLSFIGFHGFSEEPDGFQSAFNLQVARGALVLTVVSLLAYIVLVAVRNAKYTLFFPIISLLICILFWNAVSRYRNAWEETHSGRLLDRIEIAGDGAILLVLAALLMLVCVLLYVWMDIRWVLWIGLFLGTGATLLAALALEGIGDVSSGSFLTLGNFFGYSLASLLYTFGYRKKNTAEENTAAS